MNVDPAVLDCHNFDSDPNGTPDSTYGVSVNGTFHYILGWDEPEYGISTDLDLCVLNHSTGALLGCSNSDNVQTGKAYEALSGTLHGQFDVVVARHAGAATPRFKLISVRSALTAVEYPTSSGGDVVGPTIFGHNASRAGATVAATAFNNGAVPEPYSSAGPATYCWAPVNGTTPSPALSPCETATVDMTATDGVQNSFFGSQVAGIWRFYGTSAAAPHAAAVAALIRQEKPCLGPAQVMDAMKSTAHPLDGYDADAVGAGLLDGQAALAAALTESCDSTPPEVTVTFSPPAASGWYTASPVTGQVSATDPSDVTALDCTGADVSGVTGVGTSTVTATLSVSPEGSNAVSCTATDGQGNSGAADGSANTASVRIDTHAPVAAAVATPAPNAAGWNNSDVTVTWNWSDPAGGSGLDPTNCTTSTTTSGEGALDPSASCADVAGNTTTADYGVDVDKTAPTLNPVVSPNPVVLGGTASLSAGATDALSGVASQSCGALDTSTIGPKSVTCTATDVAGNVATTNVSYVVGAFLNSFSAPLPRSTLTKTSSTIPVKFTLRDAHGSLTDATAAALARNGQIRVTLSGPGTSGPVSATATCAWSSGLFQCNLKTPRGLVSGNPSGNVNPYYITVQEKGSTGAFFTVPGAGNPQVVYFH